MKSQKRIRTGLLSRVSTLAVIAAAGAFGPTQQAQAACGSTFEVPAGGQTINSNYVCVVTDAPVVAGNVINNGLIGDPTDQPSFWVTENIAGQLINNGNIAGGFFGGKGVEDVGALTINNGATISGGILNATGGGISSTSGNAFQIGGLIGEGGEGGEADGHVLNGITNENSISSGLRYGVAALYGTLGGGLSNGNTNADATITGGLAGIFIGENFTSWSDGITNHGQIAGTALGGIVMGDGGGEGSINFSGDITNDFDGIITSSGGVGILVTNDVANFNGSIINNGEISGDENGIDISAVNFFGNLENQGSITSTAEGGAAVYANTNWTGDVVNDGLISNGGEFASGFVFQGDQFFGDFTNNDRIFGGKLGSGVIFDNSELVIHGAGGEGVPAEFTNTGTISGDLYGFAVIGDDVTMNFRNTFSDEPTPQTPLLAAGTGAGLLLAANTWTGDITNDGSITGSFGMIVGGQFGEGSSIDLVTESFTGTITNNGTISGDFVGAYIKADTFEEGTSIVNEGLIEGGVTGAVLVADTFNGTFVNNGTIVGGSGNLSFNDPGLVVDVVTYNGDIVNNGTLDAATHALVVEINNLNGSIVNTGLITVDTNSDAAFLNVDDAEATFVNTDGGVIHGNVVFSDFVFGGKTAWSFVGEDGRVEGSIIGEHEDGGEGIGPNDDFVVVQNGTQAFVSDGGEGPLDRFQDIADLTVGNGGTAILGALFEGDTGGTGYTSDNLDSVHVNNGGVLYIDKATTLNVDNDYTQASGGVLEFFLGAPSGISSATGTITAVAGDDYGQVLVEGTANLDGVIAGFLDPAFASANPNLDAVVYNDVIVANNIEGDFTTLALISNSALFELNEVIDPEDGFDTVDLTVQRTDLGNIGGIGGIVVETGGPWKSMVNDRSNGIGSGSCGLAGPGWCFNKFAANEPGATQVMTDATPGSDPFDWLRTGVRRVGETAAWGRAVGVWGETDGDVNIAGSDFDSYGGIVGVDHVFSTLLMAGVAGQYTKTNIEFDGKADNADVDSYEVGAYMSYGDTRLYLNANASVIFHNIDVTRFAPGGFANGDYDGTTISGYAETGKIFETEEGFRIQPLLAVSYAHLDTDAYAETGSANVLLNVFDSEFDSIKGMAGARLAYAIPMESGRKLVPEARAVWAHEFGDDQSSFLATTNLDPVTQNLIKGETFSRDTVIVGAGVTAPLSEATSFFFDYDAGLNEDITTHTVSAGFRTRW